MTKRDELVRTLLPEKLGSLHAATRPALSWRVNREYRWQYIKKKERGRLTFDRIRPRDMVSYRSNDVGRGNVLNVKTLQVST